MRIAFFLQLKNNKKGNLINHTSINTMHRIHILKKPNRGADFSKTN